MKCEIIRDLLPLYIDQCCSDVSRAEVEKHLRTCKECNSMLKHMSEECSSDRNTSLREKEIPPCRQISICKASVLQSVLFLLSFLLIIVGVTKEAGSSYTSSNNGIWLFNLIVPATAFMLTMVNWYFIRFYQSRKIFSVSCSVIYVVMDLFANVWGLFHYNLVTNLTFIMQNIVSYLPGIILATVFVVISNLSAAMYAKFMGKF